MRTIIANGLLALVLSLAALCPTATLAFEQHRTVVSGASLGTTVAHAGDAGADRNAPSVLLPALSGSASESRPGDGAQTLRIGLSALALLVALFVQASPHKRRARR